MVQVPRCRGRKVLWRESLRAYLQRNRCIPILPQPIIKGSIVRSFWFSVYCALFVFSVTFAFERSYHLTSRSATDIYQPVRPDCTVDDNEFQIKLFFWIHVSAGSINQEPQQLASLICKVLWFLIRRFRAGAVIVLRAAACQLASFLTFRRLFERTRARSGSAGE